VNGEKSIHFACQFFLNITGKSESAMTTYLPVIPERLHLIFPVSNAGALIIRATGPFISTIHHKKSASFQEALICSDVSVH